MNDDKLQPVPTGADFPESQPEPKAEEQAKSQPEPQTTPQDETQDEEQNEAQNSPSAPTDAITAEANPANPPTPEANATNPIATNPAPAKSKKSHKALMIALVIALAALGIGGTTWALVLHQNSTSENSADDNSGDQSHASSTIPNQITNFDLAFLKNSEANQVYSPLSIKYALGMLEAGAAGDSQQQIASAIGSLAPQKYPNNDNMSFANALFVNNNLPDDIIKQSYIDTINEQFGAEALRVPFSSATPINTWVSDKTFGLINNLLTDDMLKATGGPEQYFALVNALAIDMEWVNKIQPVGSGKSYYHVSFPHINYNSTVFDFLSTGFTKLPFNNSSIDVNSLNLAATIHKYDILSDLGVDNIRQTIIDEYTDWLDGWQDEKPCGSDDWPEPEVYAEEYLEELGDGGYKTVSSSTDFLLYDDDEVKVFAKDLQTYDNITLQYVGIMPKSTSLQDYITDLTTDQLASTISRLKSITLENFKDGVITNIVANIPVFKFEDKLDLVSTLKNIGITDIFSETQANLSDLVNNSEGLYVGQAIHQTTVDFSNDGIKASAATALIGGLGSSGCGFYYNFDVPVETIDLTFDNPYLFLIRDKDSGTIWFIGTVYEPTIY